MSLADEYHQSSYPKAVSIRAALLTALESADRELANMTFERDVLKTHISLRIEADEQKKILELHEGQTIESKIDYTDTVLNLLYN